MILKTLSRHSAQFTSTINYIVNGSKTPDNQIHAITHNLASHDVGGWVREFQTNESFRGKEREGQVYFYHVILSMAENDRQNISRETMEAMAQKYFDLRGKNGVYLAAIHEAENMHLHIMESGLEFRTGKSFWQTRKALGELKINLQEFHRERFPEITHSTVRHGLGRGYVPEKAYQSAQRTGRAALKQTLIPEVKAAYEQAHSRNEFLENLRENNGLHFYERNGVPTGIITDDNLKIRFSRLGISKDQFNELKNDRSEEEKELDAIRSIREERSERNNNDRDEKENDADRDDIEEEEIGR